MYREQRAGRQYVRPEDWDVRERGPHHLFLHQVSFSAPVERTLGFLVRAYAGVGLIRAGIVPTCGVQIDGARKKTEPGLRAGVCLRLFSHWASHAWTTAPYPTRSG